jgi:WD40 repeat protein
MSEAAAGEFGNPFPGLRPFRENEEHLFFGRESQVDAIVDKLALARFLAIVGTSGSGKSSLVNCGLHPALRRGLMTGAGTSWRIVQFRPGNRPIVAMTSALAADGALYSDYSGAIPLEEIIDTSLRVSKRGLIDAFTKARLPDGVNLLVVVDQFEELFRYQGLGTSARGREEGSQEGVAFVNLLLEARRRPDLPIYIVLTMRSDFLGNCAEFSGLPEAINEGQYLVPRMTREERREAIKGPVGVGGAEICSALLTRLVNDVGDNPDQLSILQHAMNRTWAHWQYEGQREGPISLPHYEAVGTMAHALDRHAEKAYGEFGSERERTICERVFKALTDKGTDARGIRRPTSLESLCLVTNASESEVTRVIDVFRKPSRSFVMPPLPDALGADTVIDISHESLMRVWERLKVWADEEAQSAQLYRRLSETAILHADGKASPWRDPELQVALDWREKKEPTASWSEFYGGRFDLVMSFLAASEAIREKEVQEKEERQRREVDYEKAVAQAEEQKLRIAIQQKSARRLRKLMTALAILFGAALVASFWAVRQERKAESAQRESKARELAALALAGLKEDPERSILIGMQAVNATVRFGQAPLPAAEDALQRAILSFPKNFRLVHGGPVNGVAYSPDGTRVATASSDKTAKVWDATNGHLLLTLSGHSARINGIAFSPDGKQLATASDDGAVHLWDASNGRDLMTLSGNSGPVNGVAYSPDGKLLATAQADKTARIWEAKSGRQLLTLNGHSGSVTGVAYDFNGGRLATASEDNSAKIWDARDGRLLVTVRGHSDAVNAVAFSQDGKTLATASSDNTARLWDSTKGVQIRILRQLGSIKGVAFSLDGKRLATASSDNNARVWDVGKGLPILNLRVPGSANGVAFSPDGKSLASASESSVAQIWDLGGGHGLLTLRHFDPVNDVTYSPDGKRLITGSSDGTAKVWDASTGQELLKLAEGSRPVNSVSYSRDGHSLATASSDGTAWVWDAANGHLRVTLIGHSGAINGIAFSPDAKFVATAGADGTARVWAAATGQGLLLLRHNGPVNYVVYSPDGTRIATASSDGTAKVWDAAAGQTILTLDAKTGGVLDVSFSPDGKRLITAGVDNTVSVWDAVTGEHLRTIHGHAGSVLAIASCPDNIHFATASQDGTVKVWNEFTGDGLQSLAGDSGAVNSVAYSPDGKLLAAANTDGTVQVYALDVSELMNLARSRVTRNLTADECKQYFQTDGCPPLP